jgi:choline kinase
VCIVTGHNHRPIEHYLRAEGYVGTFAFNPWYKTTNAATALWLTKKNESNLVIVYGDVVFDPTILQDLLAADGDIVLAVERRTTFGADDEKVVLADNRVVRTAKDLPPAEAHGEFIGLAKLSRIGAHQLWGEIDAMIRADHTTGYFAEVFERLVARGVPISAVFTDDRAWSDINNLTDLETARERVYPRIRDAGMQRRTIRMRKPGPR